MAGPIFWPRILHPTHRIRIEAGETAVMAQGRSSGIILHITSLPSLGGVGDLGPAAYEFADFLQAAKQRVWQVLPLSPTGYGNSPYAATSAFAGNSLLISLEKLADDGWIDRNRLAALPSKADAVDYAAVAAVKLPLLEEAARNFIQRGRKAGDAWQRFEQFCRAQQHWLDDYAYSVVLRRRFGGAVWPEWPPEFARHERGALDRLKQESGEALQVEQALQFAFDEQWSKLRWYCGQRGIELMGDVAIFVNYDSVDVWTHPELFLLDENRIPLFVSGVPPDYFSATGQRWGNPLYRWDILEQSKFDWWVARIRRSRELYDLIRLDHFRGFEAYWQIPAADDTAINGTWVKAPGAELFAALGEQLGEVPFIAEDLGLITPEVTELREKFGMPGMCILQFGFGDRGAHIYLPHRFVPNTVAYTGTHDNDTTLGWWQNGASENEKQAALTYLRPGDDGIVWAMIRAAASSVANLCMMPLQDPLELGSEARMNTPSAPDGNWSWRYRGEMLRPEISAKLAALMEVTDRDGVPVP
jgi:4-alpha-glucanotransferase